MKLIPEITAEIHTKLSRRIKPMGDDSECLKWSGQGRIPRLRIGSDVFAVCKINYFLTTGEQPGINKPKRVCGNPACLNGKHLALV